MNIETNYNSEGNHEGRATATISGREYGSCVCTGLSSCGEAHFEDNFAKSIDEEQRREIRNAAYSLVKKHWDYDGSNWSKPVDKPSDSTSDVADDEHQFAIVRTSFHGGGVKAFAETQESAEEWIAFWTAGNGCKCGCYGVIEASEISDLPSTDNLRDPYALAQ